MTHLGYLPKKGNSTYFTDDLLNPTVFNGHSGSISFKGQCPVFSMTFNPIHFWKVSSGSKIVIEDIDNNQVYYLFNEEILTILQAIANGRVSVVDGKFSAIFKVVKSGSEYTIKLATEDDLQNLTTAIPEVTSL